MANVPITAGSGTNIATNAVTRDAVTEQMQLFNLADPTSATSANVVAKGTQATNAVGVQDLKDSGRTYVAFNYDFIDTITPSTAVLPSNFTLNKAGSVTTAQGSYTVATGKTFRLQAVHVQIYCAAWVSGAPGAEVYLVATTGAAIATTSPKVLIFNSQGFTAGGQVYDLTYPIPDGMEFPAGSVLGFYQASSGAVTTHFQYGISMIGYEY